MLAAAERVAVRRIDPAVERSNVDSASLSIDLGIQLRHYIGESVHSADARTAHSTHSDSSQSLTISKVLITPAWSIDGSYFEYNVVNSCISMNVL